MPIYVGGENVGCVINTDTKHNGKYCIKVIDYDGTILKEDWLNTGDVFTLPNSPTNHERLTFQEWSSPVEITNNTITVGNSDITIGAVYKTASGLTEFDIELTKATGLDVVCNMEGNKDWGDGTTDSATTHTYTNYGRYMITCDGTSLPTGTSSSSGMFSSSSTEYNNYYIEVRLSELITSISGYVFAFCKNMRAISIPNSTTIIGGYSFHYAVGLSTLILPESIRTLSSGAMYNFTNLSSIVIPKASINVRAHNIFRNTRLQSVFIPDGITSLGPQMFQDCLALTSIRMPDSITSIGDIIFSGCSMLQEIKIPHNLNNIPTKAFRNCGNILEYDFTSHSEIPTLANIDAFDGINGLCKIYVPDSLYDEWIIATNWVNYADYIYKASDRR